MDGSSQWVGGGSTIPKSSGEASDKSFLGLGEGYMLDQDGAVITDNNEGDKAEGLVVGEVQGGDSMEDGARTGQDGDEANGDEADGLVVGEVQGEDSTEEGARTGQERDESVGEGAEQGVKEDSEVQFSDGTESPETVSNAEEASEEAKGMAGSMEMEW
jgi:hypothetical protein